MPGGAGAPAAAGVVADPRAPSPSFFERMAWKDFGDDPPDYLVYRSVSGTVLGGMAPDPPLGPGAPPLLSGRRAARSSAICKVYCSSFGGCAAGGEYAPGSAGV